MEALRDICSLSTLTFMLLVTPIGKFVDMYMSKVYLSCFILKASSGLMALMGLIQGIGPIKASFGISVKPISPTILREFFLMLFNVI